MTGAGMEAEHMGTGPCEALDIRTAGWTDMTMAARIIDRRCITTHAITLTPITGLRSMASMHMVITIPFRTTRVVTTTTRA